MTRVTIRGSVPRKLLILATIVLLYCIPTPLICIAKATARQDPGIMLQQL